MDLQGAAGEPAARIYAQLLDAVIVVKAARLPARGRIAFDDQQCHPAAEVSGAIEQGAQNVGLRG